MAKKNRIYEFDDEDDVVIDKKTKRRMERAKIRESQQQHQQEEENPEDTGNDTMSQIAILCQENRWREAVVTGRAAMNEASSGGKEDMVISLSMVMEKLEMSLRRQMAAAFISKAKEMLKKEYLLDVGE